MKTIHVVLASIATIPFIALAACSGSDSGSVPDNDVDHQPVDSGADARPDAAGEDSGTPVEDSGKPVEDSGTPDDDAGDDAGTSDAGADDAGTDDAGADDAGPPPTFKISGTVINAVNGGLVLQQSGGDDLTIAPNATTFAFTTSVPTGSPYAVTIKTLPKEQACKVTSGTGTVGNADVTNVTIDCGNRTSCKEILKDIPGTASGSYRIDPDGEAKVFDAFTAYCDMTFDDGQGGGPGGWTLIESTSGGFGPDGLTEGPVAPGSAAYLGIAPVQKIAEGATQVHIRSTGAAATESATSTPDSAPIVNLRNGDNLGKGSQNTDAASLWTGPYANADRFNFNCPSTSMWPAVYQACGNVNGLHILATHSRWIWGAGNPADNIDMEVYVR